MNQDSGDETKHDPEENARVHEDAEREERSRKVVDEVPQAGEVCCEP